VGRTARFFKYVLSVWYNTYMSKLTLSVEGAVVERAKRFARRRDTSISALVERYLEALTRPAARRGGAEVGGLPPVTARLAGLLQGKGGDRESYRSHLDEKYR